MSKYEELHAVVSEERFLVDALQDIGYSPEVSSEGMSLKGYLGDERAEKADIVIRRRQLDSGRATTSASPATQAACNARSSAGGAGSSMTNFHAR